MTKNKFPILIPDNTVGMPPKIYRLETVSAPGDLPKDSWNGDAIKPRQGTVPLSQTDILGQAIISIVSLNSTQDGMPRVSDEYVTDIGVTNLWGKWAVWADS